MPSARTFLLMLIEAFGQREKGGVAMTCRKALLVVVALLAGCAVASAQDIGAGAGVIELGGWPGGGQFLVGGDDQLEVNFKKNFRAGSKRFSLRFDLFNALNGNAIFGTNNSIGSSLGNITSILMGRLPRLAFQMQW